MKVATPKIRSPLKWPGGKSYLARRIIALMPEHRVYVEPFLGGGSVLLNKTRAEREIVGDLNEDLVNFWRALRDEPLLSARIGSTPYDRALFDKAVEYAGSRHDIVRAWSFMVRNRMSRGGLGRDFAWSDRQRGGKPGDVNAWETIERMLPAIAARLLGVHLFHVAATDLIRSWDSPDTLHYCDPPYLHETRTSKELYAHEMTRSDHEDLIVTLRAARGVVMLSGYRSALYDEGFSDWHRVDFDMPNHSGQGKTKQRRVECLWSNRPFPKQEARP